MAEALRRRPAESPVLSGGAALHAVVTVARRPVHTGATVVVLPPDTGERYLSTPLFTVEG